MAGLCTPSVHDSGYGVEDRGINFPLNTGFYTLGWLADGVSISSTLTNTVLSDWRANNMHTHTRTHSQQTAPTYITH
jgi:hypothetical protein